MTSIAHTVGVNFETNPANVSEPDLAQKTTPHCF